MNYLEISKASDLKGLERLLYRLLEMLPATLSFSTLLFALIFSFIFPFFVAIFIILFDLHWLLRVIYFSAHQISAYFKLKQNQKINWQKELEKEFKNWKEIYHLVCLPFFKEGKEIVEEAILNLKRTTYPKENMIVVLAVEEKGGKIAQDIAKEMEEKYSKDFFKFFVTLHPQNLPGEVSGKGANVNFAIQKVKKELKKLKIKTENIVFSVFDIDTKCPPDYFSLVSFFYLKLKKPKNVAFQPIPLYNNNFWQAPFFSRIVAASTTFWQMIQQERPEQLVTFSSHSLSFSIFEKISYPKEVVSDDSRMFWKAFLAFDGNFKVFPLFYPVFMDAVLGKNLISTLLVEYKQQRRWAFGAENIPFLIFNFFKNKKIAISKKIFHSFVILEGFWSWAVASLLIFFLGWLPVIFGGEKFRQTLFGFSLPSLTRNLMILASFGILICGALNFLLLPKKKGFFKNFLIFFQWIFLPFTLIFFGCLPALDAQARLFLGKYLDFFPTEKNKK